MAGYIPELIEYSSSGNRGLGLRISFKKAKMEMLQEPHREASERKLKKKREREREHRSPA